MCGVLKFYGVINIDLIIDHDSSEVKLLEINPRAGISVILNVEGGFNFPLNAVYLALDRPIESPESAPSSLYMSRYYDEIFLEDTHTD